MFMDQKDLGLKMASVTRIDPWGTPHKNEPFSEMSVQFSNEILSCTQIWLQLRPFQHSEESLNVTEI